MRGFTDKNLMVSVQEEKMESLQYDLSSFVCRVCLHKMWAKAHVVTLAGWTLCQFQHHHSSCRQATEKKNI